ncbi:MAG: hypothetical protein MI974_28260 [Chitinophagales bacterium]|nr:hypothetical protein [Chitinophagales bacterium]
MPKVFSNIALAILLLVSYSSYSQNDSLINEINFFQERMELYQKWLSHSGLGGILKTKQLDVNEAHLTLYLEIPYSDIDSIFSAWNFLKREYEKSSPITLEQQLLYKAIHLMDVDQAQIRVAIYDNYDSETSFFFRGIFFHNGKVQIKEDNPKSKIRTVTFSADQLEGDSKKITVSKFDTLYNKSKVFSLIYEFAKHNFEQKKRKKCEYRNPQVTLLEKSETLRFEVVDLCREVLTDAANPILCDLLKKIPNYDCNWIKREKLTILIAYEEIPNGFNIHITIDGMYGSGMYENVGRSGYFSMEVDFDEYLERYADSFKELIRQEILSKD